MKKIFLLITLAILFFGAKQINAAGQSNCQVIYGGGQVCPPGVKFTLNKLVQRPGKGGGDFVDNLNASDQKIAPNQNVSFKIVVENTGDRKIDNIAVTDTLPQFLTFVSGPGNFDQNSRKLNFNVSGLDKGKKTEFVIVAKSTEDKMLPQDQNVICVVNNVSARENNGATASDTSQVCIERVVAATPTPQVFAEVPPKQIPTTGPEALALFALIPGGLIGMRLINKSKVK